MMYEMVWWTRSLAGVIVAFGATWLVQGCGSETKNFESGGGSGNQGGAATGGSTAGTSALGGSGGKGVGGTSTSGGTTATGGAASGTGGTEPTGGGGTTATGGESSGMGGIGPSGGGGTTATGGSAGSQNGGAGGAPTACMPNSDAMDLCAREGTSCLCCPIGGPAQACICTTACTTSAECADAARPTCNIDTRYVARGICTPEGFVCRWGARCAAPSTPIATPDGSRPISELRVGDLVYSVEGGVVVVVPIRAVRRLPVTTAHTVSRVTLVGGAVLEISAGHPTADGRLFADLRDGDDLGGARIEHVVREAPYAYPFTHDILPASSSGAYFAAGALIGSTLASGAAVCPVTVPYDQSGSPAVDSGVHVGASRD
jgi:hypothetical protein